MNFVNLIFPSIGSVYSIFKIYINRCYHLWMMLMSEVICLQLNHFIQINQMSSHLNHSIENSLCFFHNYFFIFKSFQKESSLYRNSEFKLSHYYHIMYYYFYRYEIFDQIGNCLNCGFQNIYLLFRFYDIIFHYF